MKYRSTRLLAPFAFALAAVSCASRPAAPPPSPEPVPPVVSVERAKTPPGKLTIVEFVDFECSFCRAMNDDLSPVLAAHRDEVRIVRKQIPLIAVHPHALAAARASICADQMGKGDAMADALFHTPPSRITDGGCMAIAERLGLDPERFTECFDDAGTIAKIKSDVLQFEAAAGGGVPTVWVGTQKFEGERDQATMRQAVEHALRERRD